MREVTLYEVVSQFPGKGMLQDKTFKRFHWYCCNNHSRAIQAIPMEQGKIRQSVHHDTHEK